MLAIFSSKRRDAFGNPGNPLDAPCMGCLTFYGLHIIFLKWCTLNLNSPLGTSLSTAGLHSSASANLMTPPRGPLSFFLV